MELKAKDLVKKPLTIKDISEQIKVANEGGSYKIHIPNFSAVDENIIPTLIQNGFKVYRGDWDGFMKDVLIIEW